MNFTFSFLNLYLMYVAHRDPDCPHIFYNEDNEAACCQKDIVYIHNRQRATISPWITTETVPLMKWDNVLAKKAQGVARKCKFKYEVVEDRRFYTEQNMLLKCSNSDDIKPNWTEVIQNWFSVNQVRPKYATSSTETGQITWKKLYTNWVGCGYANYKINASDFTVEERTGIYLYDNGTDFCQVYICLYGPV